MTWSANELSTLCAKAARGAGAPPAQAAMFGRAALVHITAGHGCAALADALATLPGGPIHDLPLQIAALAETATDGVANGVLRDADTDLLLKSYLAAQPFETKRDPDQKVQLNLTIPAPRKPAARIDVPDACADRLRDLAARLLVPETDASRLGGAGAGLTDND